MITKLTALMACLLTMVFLAGCNEGSSGSAGLFGGSSGGNNIVTTNLPGGSSSGSDTGDSSYSDSSSGDIVEHLPEPATLALLGSGLLAYAFFRRKKKK